MDTLKPRTARIMFVAGVVMLIISTTLSLINVATVLSAPYATVVTVPNTVGFEGYISGASGTQTLTFKIYDAASGGNIKWDQTVTGVAITSGLYSVTLGGAADPFLSDTFTGDRWLGVTYNSVEQTPRTKITSVPFAIHADSTSKVQGVSLANMVAIFENGCPSPGWEEVQEIRGRVVVGVPLDGTAGLPVGLTALGNGEDRTHTHTLPSHVHQLAQGASVLHNAANSVPVVINGNGTTPNTFGTGSNPQQLTYYLSGVTTGWSGDSGTVAIADLMPYIQLFYCRFTP